MTRFKKESVRITSKEYLKKQKPAYNIKSTNIHYQVAKIFAYSFLTKIYSLKTHKLVANSKKENSSTKIIYFLPFSQHKTPMCIYIYTRRRESKSSTVIAALYRNSHGTYAFLFYVYLYVFSLPTLTTSTRYGALVVPFVINRQIADYSPRLANFYFLSNGLFSLPFVTNIEEERTSDRFPHNVVTAQTDNEVKLRISKNEIK